MVLHPPTPRSPPSPAPSLLSLNLQGIKTAVKPNWKRNGFVQWGTASINPHLMRRRKAKAETGEFAAVREAVHYLSGEGGNRRSKGQVNGQIDEEQRVKRTQPKSGLSWAQTH